MTSKVRSFARSSHHSFPLSRRERGTGGEDILVRREQRTEAQNLKREEPRAKTFCGPVKIFCGPEKETWPSTNEWPRTETEPYRFVKEACGAPMLGDERGLRLGNGMTPLRKKTIGLLEGRMGLRKKKRGGLGVSDGAPSGGVELRDGGLQLRDGGAPLRDGGAPLRDGGSQLRDGGSQLQNGGSQLRDGRAPLRNGRVPLRDGW